MELGNQQNPYGALIVTASVMFAVLMGVFVVKPLLDSNEKYSFEKKQAQATFDRYQKKKTILAGIKDNAEEHAKFKSAEANILKAIPQNNDQPNTYSQIEGITNEIGIKTSSVKETASDSGSEAIDGVDASVHEIPLDVTSKGDYNALIKTFEKLETNLRLFNVKKISLQPEGNVLSYSLNVVAYYKDEVQLED